MTRIVVVGSLNMDLIVQVDRLPAPGETVPGRRAVSSHGGKGGNQAFYAARSAADGVPVRLVACVGDDAAGQELVEGLAAAGVDTTDVRVVGTPSGFAVVLVDAVGENQIAVVGGANHAWPESTLELDLRAEDLVVLQAEVSFEVIEQVAESARARGARCILNAAPFDPRLPGLLASGDVLVLNEVEAAEALACDPDGIASSLAESGLPCEVIVTLGAEGALVSSAPHDGIDLVPAFTVTVADTVGAGDAFVGALASGLADGRSLLDATRFSAAAAALAASSPGARNPLVDRTRVLEMEGTR